MHCDISGFTAMSESLAQLGKEGAELMAGVLNQFFERMLGISDGYGGAQLKFGGDAMLLFFSGEQHLPRAAACGLAMQTAMREFRHVTAGGQQHGLRMRAGIHAGKFFSASVGNP
ncbi:MAG: adenylate/guanylate cyclase domain-containing protein, partial [Dehalococcoidia bacterium]